MRKVLSSVIRSLPSDFYKRTKESGIMIASAPMDEGILVKCTGDPAGIGVLIATALSEIAKQNPGAIRANVFAACKTVEDEIRDLDYEDQKVSKLDEFQL